MSNVLILVIVAGIISGIVLHLLFNSGILNKATEESKKLVQNLEETTEQQLIKVKV